MSGVSTSGHASAVFTIPSLHCAHDIAWGLEGGHDESWDADLPADVARLKANHASGKETRAHGERERNHHGVRCGAKRQGTEASPRSASSGEKEVESGGGGGDPTHLVSPFCDSLSTSRCGSPAYEIHVRQMPTESPLG
jgi:hypothetical protein